MPLYTDPGYSYYSGGGSYSPYYSTPLYGSSSSSPYAPYSSSYNRSYSGTYVLPPTPRTSQYTSSVSRYHPKLSTITESPLASRGNFIPLTRIQSPKISTYSPSLSTAYISTRPSRPKTINTADIDVSASSRYGRHHHMDDRKDDEEKPAAIEEVQVANTSESDTISSVVDTNSPFMPRVDGSDAGRHARSTIKRNRTVVRLSIMRPRSRDGSKKDDGSKNDDGSMKNSENSDEEIFTSPEPAMEINDSLERSYVLNKAKEEGKKLTFTDMEKSQTSEISLSELIIEVDPITNTVRRLSIPQVPTFHDICEDISSDKIDDDLNAGVLRRRASLIQEQEMEILNELQRSQSGSFQVIHLERNASLEDSRKSRKSKKVKKIRHKITANVDIDNPPLTPVIKQTIDEEIGSVTSPTLPKFTFSIEDIEEHKIFKLPKKRVKSVKSKRVEEKAAAKLKLEDNELKETPKLEKSKRTVTVTKPLFEKDVIKSPIEKQPDMKEEQLSTEKDVVKPASLDKQLVEIIKQAELKTKKQTPEVTKKIEKSESGIDFWSEINTRESLRRNELAASELKVEIPKPTKEIKNSESAVDFWSEINTRESLQRNKKAAPETKVETLKPTKEIEISESDVDFWSEIDTRESLQRNTQAETPKLIKKIEKSESGVDFWSQINTNEFMQSGREKEPETKEVTPYVKKSESSEDFWSQIETRESLYMNKRKKVQDKMDPLIYELERPPTPTNIIQPLAKDILPALMTESTKTEDQQPTSPRKLITKPQSLDITKLAKNDDTTPTTAKKTAIKTQDSPKSKNLPKLVSKKKTSPKNDAKEEAADSNSKPKTKPTVSVPATNEKIIPSPKINSSNGAKSPEKKKTVKCDNTTVIKQSIINENTSPAGVNSTIEENKWKKIPDITTKTNEPQTPKQELKLKKPLTPTSSIAKSSEQLTIAENDVPSGKTGNVKPATCDYKPDNEQKSSADSPKTSKRYATSLSLELSPVPSSTKPMTPATPEAQSVVTSLLSPPSTPKPTADASTAQVSTTAAATTITKNSPTTPTDAAASTAPSSSSKTTTECNVVGSGGNNLSKFAKISNLARCLLDVDADLEDYMPSSDEETDSSGDSYSENGSSLSASMKKKNKQLKKKAKEQAFDPNKKIKIDTKKKCYVKEEAPRYPLVATPRPLWKREKVPYEESSNSSSEETDSESECTTSDEYEDELCPKDAIIRMSTCSNDSGFDGGTAPSNGKKVLDTSYTYLQFQKSGRITAPATTIPRFKKYSVEDFHFLAVLGKGSFGKVLLAELRNTDFYYAVKCLKKDVVLEDDDVECTLIERKVLALGTKHPYLCHLFCTFQTESHLFFVMEYLNGGDLMFHIQESGRFPEDRARFYAAEIISGLKFLHKKGIIYRDLKLDNVLLDFDGHVRIADFGMCKLQIYLDKTADSFCGTPDYMAPEIIKGDKYNQNVDWWSFGVLLYEMLIGQSPFSGCDEDELFWSICNEIPWFPVYITLEATIILKGLLEKDYTRRIGSQYSPAGDICDHIFFKDIDWGLLEKRQLPPPFKPQVKHPLDTQYFDRAFTRERVRLTPIDKEILQSMDQEQFQGFSYTNPNATLD